MYVVNMFVEQYFPGIFSALKNKVDNALVKCDGWWLVFLAVLLALAFTIFAGMSIWCVVYKGKRFTGDWSWAKGGTKLSVECK